MKAIAILFLFFTVSSIYGQTIVVKPYLQDALPNSIHILWETDFGEESTVEWGLTEDLGNTASGVFLDNDGQGIIHTVQLQELERFTRYYYRVITGDAESDISYFKTPPFASDHSSFRIAAMSDMQRDNDHPDKFQEIVEEGVISYLENEIGGDVTDNLALVMIPGDLVQNGFSYQSWKTTFFDPGYELFRKVPVYPVLGNHENNTVYFVNYFKLPENGSLDFEEHWWYKDYGNTRIIGLDSNAPFTNQTQLDWLQEVLDDTCQADSIDFVFAQLHHPHHSELWTPGNLDYTGDVIEKLEQFSTECDKPSIHFFGHTHAYSRGHSRDHKHLMVNAASAGGAIDNWGEFPNFDYDEYAVSTDDYGFVIVEVTDDDDPKVTLMHYSMGDQDLATPYLLNDSLTIRKSHENVYVPEPIYPVDIQIAPECIELRASEFTSESGNTIHGQSHWQVTDTENDFSNLAGESWKNFENWYSEVDTQSGDDLTDEAIENLEPNTQYWWRVRYRDRELNWSDWSNSVTFSTIESALSENLLSNPGAEQDLDGWVTVEGVVEAQTDGNCAGISPNSGTQYFAVGGLCEHSEIGIAIQNVDVSAFSDSIDVGSYSVRFGGYLSNYDGSDLPEIKVLFLDESNSLISESETVSSLLSSWTMHSQMEEIPPLTRMIQMELKGTRNSGQDNDSYFDDLFLQVGSTEIDCSSTSSIANVGYSTPLQIEVIPNPLTEEAQVRFQNARNSKAKIQVVNQLGVKLECPTVITSDGFRINVMHLEAGNYFLVVRNADGLIASGRFTKL